MTMSGATPYSPSMRVMDMSVASTAGWVISVFSSSDSSCLTAAGSLESMKM